MTHRHVAAYHKQPWDIHLSLVPKLPNKESTNLGAIHCVDPLRPPLEADFRCHEVGELDFYKQHHDCENSTSCRQNVEFFLLAISWMFTFEMVSVNINEYTYLVNR